MTAALDFLIFLSSAVLATLSVGFGLSCSAAYFIGGKTRLDNFIEDMMPPFATAGAGLFIALISLGLGRAFS